MHANFALVVAVIVAIAVFATLVIAVTQAAPRALIGSSVNEQLLKFSRFGPCRLLVLTLILVLVLALDRTARYECRRRPRVLGQRLLADSSVVYGAIEKVI